MVYRVLARLPQMQCKQSDEVHLIRSTNNRTSIDLDWLRQLSVSIDSNPAWSVLTRSKKGCHNCGQCAALNLRTYREEEEEKRISNEQYISEYFIHRLLIIYVNMKIQRLASRIMIEASLPHAMASVEKSSPILRYVINEVPGQKCLIIVVIGVLNKFSPQDSHALKCVIIEIFRESAYTE